MFFHDSHPYDPIIITQDSVMFGNWPNTIFPSASMRFRVIDGIKYYIIHD